MRVSTSIKILVAYLIASSWVSTGVSSAQEQILSGIIATAPEPIKIFQSLSDQSAGRIASTGDPVYLNEQVVTGDDHGAEILLKDQSTLTLGPNANVVIDQFVYDPEGEQSMLVSIRKGGFKFVSGKIAGSGPDAMQIRLPNATASIRGTSGVGRVYEDGRTEMALLSGQIQFTDALGFSTDLIRSGWGVTISENIGISAPAPIETDLLENLIDEVALTIRSQGNTEDTEALTEDRLSNDLSEAGRYITDNIAISEDGKVDAKDIVTLLLKDEELLLRSGLDPDLIRGEIPEGVSFDIGLLEFLVSGQTPHYMTLSNNGSEYYLGNPDHSLFSEIYAGSVTWSGSGLQLVPNNDRASAGNGARADYSITLDYDRLTFSGHYKVYDIALGGRSYKDTDLISIDANYPASSDDQTIYKSPNFDADGDLNDHLPGHDENGNGLLDPGENLEGIYLDRSGISGEDGNTMEAVSYLSGSFGSIAREQHVADGVFAEVSIEVMEIDNSDPDNPVFTDESVGGTEYSLGK